MKNNHLSVKVFALFSIFCCLAPSAFAVTSVVKFNGVTSKEVEIRQSTKKLTATVPPGATTGPISIETDQGGYYSSTDFEVIQDAPAPYNLAAKSGIGSVDLEWEEPASPYVVGYEVYRGTKKGSYPDKIGNAAGSAFTDPGKNLNIGDTYYYAVKAIFFLNGETLTSGFSTEASVVFGSIILSIPEIRGAAGSEIIVSVNIANADKLQLRTADIGINYNASVLTPSRVESAILTHGFTWGSDFSTTSGEARISLDKGSSTTLIGEGAFFNVIFTVSSSAAEDGTEYPLTFSSDSKMTNQKGKAIPITFTLSKYLLSHESFAGDIQSSQGSFVVSKKYVRGDVSGDGEISSVDLSQAFIFSQGLDDPDSLQLSAGDISGDGKVDTNDAGLINYYVVNGSWPTLKNTDVTKSGRKIGLSSAKGKKNKNVTLKLKINNLNDVNSGDLRITYDPKNLTLKKIIPTPFAKDNYKIKTDVKRKGFAIISLAYNKAGRAVISPKNKEFAKITFTAKQPGSHPVKISTASLYDRFGRDFVKSDLKMKIKSPGAKIKVKGKAKKKKKKKLVSHQPLSLEIVSFSPNKGKAGTSVTININSTEIDPLIGEWEFLFTPADEPEAWDEIFSFYEEDGTLKGIDPAETPGVLITKDPSVDYDYEIQVPDNDNNYIFYYRIKLDDTKESVTGKWLWYDGDFQEFIDETDLKGFKLF